ARRGQGGRARRRGRGWREKRSCGESFRLAALLASDLSLVAAREVAVPHDLRSADVEPVDAVRAGEDQAGDRIRGAAELEAVDAPDGEVGALPGRELPDVVAAEDGGAPACPQPQRVARGQGL